MLSFAEAKLEMDTSGPSGFFAEPKGVYGGNRPGRDLYGRSWVSSNLDTGPMPIEFRIIKDGQTACHFIILIIVQYTHESIYSCPHNGTKSEMHASDGDAGTR